MNAISTKISLSLLVLLSTTMTACTRTGPSISGDSVLVTPVVYEYSVTVKQNASRQATEEILAYIEKNEYQLLVHGVDITWHGRSTKKIAQRAYKALISRGISLEKLSMNASGKTSNNSVTLSTVIHQVQTPTCTYAIISDYHRSDDGCYSESIRWESMVYPDNKIAGQGRLSIDVPVTH